MSESKETRFCNKCGKEIPVASEFCPFCGAKQNNSVTSNNESSQNSVQDSFESQKKQSAWGIWIAVGWIFFAARFILTDYATVCELIAVVIGVIVQIKYREHKYAGMALWIITLAVSTILAVIYYSGAAIN